MNASSNPQELAQHELADDLPTAGQILREVREQNGLTVDQIAAYLKLSPRQIHAIEADAHDQLPGKAFVRGLIRSYGRVLNLDSQALLERLTAQSAIPAVAPGANEPTAGSSGRGWQMWLIPIVLALILGITGYQAREKSQRATTAEVSRAVAAASASARARTAPGQAEETATTATDVAAPPNAKVSNPSPGPVDATGEVQTGPASLAPNPPANLSKSQPETEATNPLPAGNSENGSVEFTFSDLSWVEVRDQTGQIVITGSNQAGTKQAAQGKTPLSVVIGNADQVKMSYNGKQVDLAPYVRQNVARLTLQ